MVHSEQFERPTLGIRISCAKRQLSYPINGLVATVKILPKGAVMGNLAPEHQLIYSKYDITPRLFPSIRLATSGGTKMPIAPVRITG